VINAAAWTAVDGAETERDAADRANHTGPALLAAACRAAGTQLIHISTDYVFDGLKGAPYTEADPTCPTGVYGATKRAGEQAVLAAFPEAVILRTSWVYARTGKNFVLTMLNAAKRAPRLRVVADQIGCPTNAEDLAAACLAVADQLLQRPQTGAASMGGIYHAAGQGETSWHGLAVAIFETAARHGWPTPPVDAIATSDWPTPARRPPDSRLDCGKLASTFDVRLPKWRPSLDAAVAGICQRALATAPG
jgi:dTDP-4-dehydrorhamnose reductase